ncbi:MAG: leucine-rich repeat domain-containing protein, partial [Acetatifactor sp.]|nr:leucine-rich repeat domain-containing protein [Acetatifactor sp.]
GNIIYEADNVTPKMVQDVDTQGNLLYETFWQDDKVMVDDMDSPRVTSEYLPCYYSDKNDNGWGGYNLEDFYTLKDKDENGVALDYNNYDSTNHNHFERVGVNEDKQWITHVAVAYIGNQSVTTGAGGVTTIGPWITYDNNNAQKGVFQGKSGNVVNLTVGENLIGIGNYAFADCSSLQSITLGNGLKAIGNHAFDSCINIKEINVDTHSNLEKIGDHAFYNCQSLRTFKMPVPVKKIGDGVFENCYALAEIGLYDKDEIKALETIGDHAFMNCRSLTSLIIPNNVRSDKLELSMVYGCRALQSITVINENANFVAGKNPADVSKQYGFEEFKESMPETFYFEGVNTAYTGDTPLDNTLHKTANDNSIAFKYLNEDVYEIVIKDPNDPTKKAIYRVNSSNQLIYCHLDSGMSTVEMPSTIGPYRITAINSNSFQNNCALKKITIPSSVLTIAENAFKGCHHLEHVIFESPVQCQIGANAFKTQDISTNMHRD